MERPLGKHKLCLVRVGQSPSVQLEIWYKTRRRKSPYDRMLVATMGRTGGSDGLSLHASVNSRAEPLLDGVRELLPAFDAMAIVETVSLR